MGDWMPSFAQHYRPGAVVVDFLPVLRPNEGLHNFRLSSQRREYLFPILVFHEGNVVIVPGCPVLTRILQT